MLQRSVTPNVPRRRRVRIIVPDSAPVPAPDYTVAIVVIAALAAAAVVAAVILRRRKK